MPRIGPERRAARRDQFLTAARQIARERGYRGVTVDDVCAAAGLSKGAFYAHFESKRDLLLAMLTAESTEVAELLAKLATGERGYPERLREFLREMVHRGEDPAEVALRAEVWSQIAVDEALRERMAAVVAHRRQLLAAFAWMGGHEGEMVELPANAFGAILVALVDGLLLHRAVDPQGFRWKNIQIAVDVIFDSLSRLPADGRPATAEA